MHVDVVWLPPPNGELPPPAIPAGKGDCCQVMVLVTSQSPAFGLCARAQIPAVKRQHPTTHACVLRILSPFSVARQGNSRAELLYFSESATRKRNRGRR